VCKWQDCDLYISVRLDEGSADTGELKWTYDSTGLKPHQFMPTCLHGVSRLMYQMYCAGSKIIFDEGIYANNYDPSYPERY
jgi:hypothetical protein